jgi:heme A synthase
MVWGIVLGILAVVTLIFVARMPSKSRRLLGLTVGIGVDILIQGLLGFAAQNTGNSAISWVHFLNALAIYGMTLAGMFMTTAASQMTQPLPAVSAS